MDHEKHSEASQEQRLAEVVTAFLKADEAGQTPVPGDWLARHPDLADELSDFFAGRQHLETLAAPLRGRPSPAPVPDSFGDYEILEEIARGGMGVVFKARQKSLDRIVALKMILAGRLASSDDVRRFTAEARAVAGFDHPHIVPIYEIGEYQGQPYFTMKLMEGGSLAHPTAQAPFVKGSKEAQRQAAGALAAIARAVHHAHQHGILHRDLKPANILLDAAGTPYVTDFGLAKRVSGEPGASVPGGLTQTGAIVGTPSYMAPEQASGQKRAVTTLADVYSLGAILYELLTGQPPFRAESSLDTLLQVLEYEPVRPRSISPRIDRDLEMICLKCLQKDPAQRYASAGDLAADLEHWLAGEPLTARPPSAARLVWLWLRKNVRTTLWPLVIGLVCGGLAILAPFNVLRLIMQNGAVLYERHFPDLAPPLLAVAGPNPTWLLPLGALGMLAWILMGWLAVRLVQPRDTLGDLAAGLATGMVAGVVMFIGAVSWILLLRFALVPSLADLDLLARAADRPHADALLEAYPDLRSAPAEQRGKLLADKIACDLALRLPLGIWFGTILVATVFGLFGMAQALAAGYLRRRGEGRNNLLPYLELVVPCYMLIQEVGVMFILPLLNVSIAAHDELNPASLAGRAVPRAAIWFGVTTMLFKLVLVGVAFTGVFRRWPGPLRAALYVVWLTAVLHVVEGPLPWYVYAASGVLVVVLATRLHKRMEGETTSTVRATEVQ
jgi:tRNA A-37 threonylcarbamoyl transferase component Bud32